MSGMRAAAVIPAGGAGKRMAGVGGTRKQYLELGGEPILLRSLRVFLDHPSFYWVVVALPAEDMASPPLFMPEGVTVVAGGSTRGDSVRFGLDAVPASAGVVVVHDAARPLVTRDMVDRVLEAVGPETGAIAAVPESDTLKRVAGDGGIVETVARHGLWRAQTPQAFPRDMLVDAYRRAREENITGTDEASLVERYGGRVLVVEGSHANLKLTTPEDLRIAERLLGMDPATAGSG